MSSSMRAPRYGVELGVIAITKPPYWGRPRDLHPLIENLAEQMFAWLLLPADWMHNIDSGELIRSRCRALQSVGRVRWFESTPHTSFENCAWHAFGLSWIRADQPCFFRAVFPVRFPSSRRRHVRQCQSKRRKAFRS
jgi:hypothetical protein